MSTTIRKSNPSDISALQELYQQAFPDEDLLPLVLALLGEGQKALSLVAVNEKQPVGHVLFTHCCVSTNDNIVALLGPLAVLPEYQRRSIGSALVDQGLQHLKNDTVSKVLVLGVPDYYHRFGFKEETDILPAYPIPDEWQPAWQSLNLNQCDAAVRGTLIVPEPWQKAELWSS